MRVEIVEAHPVHLIDLMSNLRPREVQLCWHMYGRQFVDVIVTEMGQSVVALAGLYDGNCVALWGIKTADILSGEGYVWLIGSRLIDEHPVIFLRHCRRVLAELRRTFSVLRGGVAVDYTDSRRWIEWLGFTIGPSVNGICPCEIKWE